MLQPHLIEGIGALAGGDLQSAITPLGTAAGFSMGNPATESAVLFLTFLVTASYAVTDRFAMNPADGNDQAEAYYAVAEGDRDRAGGALVVRMSNGDVFATVGPCALSADEHAPSDSPTRTEHHTLTSGDGERMTCTLTDADRDGNVDRAGCETSDGRLFELRT